jgi:hypothetical protein
MSVISKNVWGVVWFKNASDQGGALRVAMQYCEPDEVVVHSQTQKNGRMWACVKHDKLLELIESNHGIYEVLTTFPQKVYFDLDKKGCHPEYRAWAIDQIEKILPGAELALAGSLTTEKTSIHVVIQNYQINSVADQKAMQLITKRLDGFDEKVYTKNRNMKCTNQSKLDGRVQAVITESDLRKHLITCFQTEMLPLPISADVIEDIQVHATYDMSTLPKTVMHGEINLDEMTPVEMMHALPISPEWMFKDSARVLRFAYHIGIPFGEFLTWAHKKHEDDAKWAYQWSKANKFPPVTIASMKEQLKHFYPKATRNKDLHFTNFKNTFDLPPTEKVATLTPECFKGDEKYLCINTGMGSGKTAQTCNYLKGREFIWIAPIIALARNLKSRVKASYYKDVIEDMNQPRLLVCMNSLHYVKRNYKIVVIDESETVLMKWMGDFMNQKNSMRKSENWKVFHDLIERADKVIVLDAFTSTKTLDLMQQICPGKLRIIERIEEPVTRTVCYVKTVEQMIERMIADLAEDKKIFCYYPQKHQTNNAISMQGLHDLLAINGKKGIYYNSEIDEVIKGGLQDVNAVWSNLDFVITNNTITCGVNYDLATKPFDTAYIFIASYTQPRDAIQVSYRPRILTSNTIFVTFMGKMNQREVWEDDTGFCPKYKSLYQANLLELKAPNRKTFAFLCTKAHYKQTTDDTEFCKEQAEKIQVSLKEHATGYSYSGLEDIDLEEADIIKEKMISGDANMVEKYQHARYFFRRQFRHPKLPEVEAAWNQQWIRLTSQIRATHGQGTIFDRIARLNHCNGFPTSLDKVVLTPELRNEIFETFNFKHLTHESTTVNILRHIYNEHFGLIYETKYEGKHVSYDLVEGVEDFYFFVVLETCRTGCRCDKFDIGPFGLCQCGGYKKSEPENHKCLLLN